jgi:TctA family transporter
MSIDDKLMTVKLAEIDCQAATVRARDSWGRLSANFKDAATPWRIVTIGAVSGFLMGRSGGGAAGASLGGKLFASAAQAVITAMGASAASGVAADAAAKSAADASASATSEAIHREAAVVETDAMD